MNARYFLDLESRIDKDKLKYYYDYIYSQNNIDYLRGYKKGLRMNFNLDPIEIEYYVILVNSRIEQLEQYSS